MGVDDNFKKLKSIFHLIIMALELAMFFSLSNLICIKCSHNLVFQQFIDATYSGFLVIMFVACIGICVQEEFGRQTLMAITYCGGIFNAISAILIGLEINREHLHFRILIAEVVAIILCVLFFLEAIYVTMKKDDMSLSA